MENQIVTQVDADAVLRMFSDASNENAKKNLFSGHWDTLSLNAQGARDAAFKTWSKYLAEKNASIVAKVAENGGAVDPTKLFCTTPERWRDEPEVWRPVTWGIVSDYRSWLVGRGYSVATINNRLTAVRTFARMAATAGAITPFEGSTIATVKGYGYTEGVNLDQGRTKVRYGHKKAASVDLTRKQAQALLKQPNTSQGRRDALLMALLLIHGMRVSEVALLPVSGVNLDAGEARFYRPKTKEWGTHKFMPDSKPIFERYLKHDAPAMGQLLRTSNKHGTLGEAGMSERSIQERVRVLGERVGVKGMSPHDCRHYCATRLAKELKSETKLMAFFGWNSTAMAARYIQRATVANEDFADLEIVGTD